MNNMLFENQAIAKMFQYTIPPPGQMPTIPNLNLSAPTFETSIKLSNPDLTTQLTAACTQVQQAQQQQQQVQQQALVALPQIPAQQPQVQQQQPQSQQQPQQQPQSQQPLPTPLTTNTNSTSSGRSTPNNLDSSAVGKLFVGGLSWQTSSDKLKEYFGRYGTVTDVLIMKDPATQRSRGFGFITFAEANSVENVLRNPLHLLDGKKIDPKHATPKNRPKVANKTKKIFVGGVSQETSSDEVKAYFNQFGLVEETVMLMDQQTKRHRGFGFVTFESEDVVDRVCEIHYHMIKNKKVECKKAQPKEIVTTGPQMFQKRILLGGLGGIRLAPTSPLLGTTVATGNPLAAHLQTAANTATQMMPHHHAAAAAAAAFQMQNAAQYQNCVQNVPAGGYGKIFATYPQAALHGFRYAPYGLPANAAAAAAQMQAAAATNTSQQTAGHTPQNQVQPAALTPVAAQNPYQGYSLANIDMSSFQGVDWSSMYGMYV